MRDLFQEIKTLKKQKNATILAHYYQDPDIQDVADVVGDSLELARAAQRSDADLIVFAGVHFMAEGAKILNPKRKVVLPDLRAGCSLSDSCPPEAFSKFIEKLTLEHGVRPFVVTYINCSAAVKALSDVICTSSNAIKMVETAHQKFPDRPILFAPDRNLGRWVSEKTGIPLILWAGTCMVHETFSERKILELQIQHPKAELIAHPECEENILKQAKFIGSTSQLLKYVVESKGQSFIVATEAGILHQMQKKAPGKLLIAAPPNHACACNECPFMKLNTLEKLYECLKNESPEIEVPLVIREKAEAALLKMMEWSK